MSVWDGPNGAEVATDYPPQEGELATLSWVILWNRLRVVNEQINDALGSRFVYTFRAKTNYRKLLLEELEFRCAFLTPEQVIYNG